MSREIWVMPEWMEPYRKLINNTGGDTIENLMNDHTSNSFNNVIRAGLICCVDSQVRLLHTLRKEGILKWK